MTKAQKRKLAAKAKLWMTLHGTEKNGKNIFEDDVWCAGCRYRNEKNECKKVNIARWWYLYNNETEKEKIVKKIQNSFAATASCVERFI